MVANGLLYWLHGTHTTEREKDTPSCESFKKSCSSPEQQAEIIDSAGPLTEIGSYNTMCAAVTRG